MMHRLSLIKEGAYYAASNRKGFTHANPPDGKSVDSMAFMLIADADAMSQYRNAPVVGLLQPGICDLALANCHSFHLFLFL